MAPKQEPLILAIETATRAGSVSLAAGKRTLRSVTGDAAVSHSTNLIEQIDELLRTEGLRLDDIDLFATAVGPGSFTGLRIGLATVKAFATCLDRMCIGVSTLAAIAHDAGPSLLTVAMLPAGRGESFVQLFRVSERSEVESLDRAAHLSPEMILEKYRHQRFLKWAGQGAQVQAQTLKAWAESNGIPFVESNQKLLARTRDQWTLVMPGERLAESVSALALREHELGNTISPDELRAVYVRPSDAETNTQWQERKSPSAARS